MERVKLLLLDRDGVLNAKPSLHRYVRNVSELFLYSEVISLVAEVSQNLEVAVVSNQQGVSTGIFSSSALSEISDEIQFQVSKAGGREIKFYYCTHLESADCGCRKPKPGLILQAAREFQVLRKEIVFIGDQPSDEEAAKNAGVNFIHTTNSKSTVSILTKLLQTTISSQKLSE